MTAPATTATTLPPAKRFPGLAELIGYLDTVRDRADLKVLAGLLGTSGVDETMVALIRQWLVCAVADGAVVGSALVEKLAAAADSQARVAIAESMIRELKSGTKNV